MKQMINFNQEGLQGLHFFTEGLNFPIAVGTYSDWEETQVSYFLSSTRNRNLNEEDICCWCVDHQIEYQIMYPVKRYSVFRNPYKYFKFLQLKRKLKIFVRSSRITK